METPEARLRNRLQIAVSALEVAANRLDALADRVGADRALAREVRDIATWCSRAADAAARR